MVVDQERADELSIGFQERQNRREADGTITRTKANLIEVSVVLQGAYGRKALVSAVRTVASGGSLFDDLGPAAPRTRGPVLAGGDRLDTLTDQEGSVLRLIGEGLTNRQIGERMGLAEKTVKNYTSHLLAKLGLERRTQAAILATQLRDSSRG